MLWILVSVALGASIGAAIGHFGRCSTGGCVMFSSWKRGLIVGAVIGLLNGLGSIQH